MGNTWRQPETRLDKKGDKGRQDLGKTDTPSNTGAHMRGDNGREWGTMGEQGFQQGETRRDTMGDTLRKAGTQSNKGKQEGAHWDTRGALRKVDAPSNKGKQKGKMGNGRQRETRPSERRTDHPTKGNKKR